MTKHDHLPIRFRQEHYHLVSYETPPPSSHLSLVGTLDFSTGTECKVYRVYFAPSVLTKGPFDLMAKASS